MPKTLVLAVSNMVHMEVCLLLNVASVAAAHNIMIVLINALGACMGTLTDPLHGLF